MGFIGPFFWPHCCHFYLTSLRHIPYSRLSFRPWCCHRCQIAHKTWAPLMAISSGTCVHKVCCSPQHYADVELLGRAPQCPDAQPSQSGSKETSASCAWPLNSQCKSDGRKVGSLVSGLKDATTSSFNNCLTTTEFFVWLSSYIAREEASWHH